MLVEICIKKLIRKYQYSHVTRCLPIVELAKELVKIMNHAHITIHKVKTL